MILPNEAMIMLSVSLYIPPFFFAFLLARLEIGEIAEVASSTKGSLMEHPIIARLVIMMKLLKPRIVFCYVSRPTFDVVEPLQIVEVEPQPK